MGSKTNKDLPKSDRNERLERLSRKALDAILPVEKFLQRQEYSDKGIDSSIEVIDGNEDFTNFRAQIQLKGTCSSKINKDGSVSYSIKTSNLEYLWNNLISIYVLFIEPRNELRFVWLKDEIKRLDEQKPNWKNQKEVVIKFTQILNEETLEQIHKQIIKESSLHKKIKETLTKISNKNLKFEIDSVNLNVTDPNEAKNILDLYGNELLNSGYERFVLEKYNLLTDDNKKRVEFLLLKARAEGLSGEYRASLDTLAIINLTNDELSPVEKFNFESIENHSNWQLGEINTEQFLTKLKELSKNDLVKDSILDKFNFLRFSLLQERDIDKFVRELPQLRKMGEEILADENFSNEIKISVEFSILDCELKWLILENTSLNGESAIYEVARVYIPEHWDRKEIFDVELKKWVDESNELINKTQNIITIADIAYLQTRLWFHLNQSKEFWSANTEKEYIINKEHADYFIEKLQTAINIFVGHQQYYSIIRAKMLMVEILSLLGKFDESETLRKQINSQSKKMSYSALSELTEFSLHKTLFEYSQEINSKKSS
jgi:Domain of unknown function (DUF4365)